MLNKPLIQSSKGTAIVLSIIVVLALLYGAVGVRQYFYAGTPLVDGGGEEGGGTSEGGTTGGTTGEGTCEVNEPNCSGGGTEGGGTTGGETGGSEGGSNTGSGGTTGGTTGSGSGSTSGGGSSSGGSTSSTTTNTTTNSSSEDQTEQPTKTTAINEEESKNSWLEFFSGTTGNDSAERCSLIVGVLPYFIIPMFFLLVLILIMLYDTRRRVIDLQHGRNPDQTPPTK